MAICAIVAAGQNTRWSSSAVYVLFYPVRIEIDKACTKQYSIDDDLFSMSDIGMKTQALPFDHKLHVLHRYENQRSPLKAERAVAKECILFLCTLSTAGSQQLQEQKTCGFANDHNV